jgi:hypothetical protein
MRSDGWFGDWRLQIRRLVAISSTSISTNRSHDSTLHRSSLELRYEMGQVGKGSYGAMQLGLSLAYST